MQHGLLADLARRGSATVHHVITDNRALWRLNDLKAFAFSGDVCRLRPTVVLQAILTRAQRHGHHYIGHVDPSDVRSNRPIHSKRMPQPVHLVFGIDQPKRTAVVPVSRLPGFGLEFYE